MQENIEELKIEEVNVYLDNYGKIRISCVTDCLISSCFISCAE